MEEFETAFKAFDKDSSNRLSPVEFKACLASLGTDYSDEEFKEIFEGVSSDDSVNFEQFLQFMVSITEDRTTIDQLIKSFRDIANGKKFITEVDLLQVQIAPEQVEYLKSVMPQSAESEYDFESYLRQAFASQ